MSNKNINPLILEERLVDFASRIIGLAEKLPITMPAQRLGKQLVRSGSSPALNYGEARGAESSKDFVHKMKICLKELRETIICLKIINRRNWFPDDRLADLLSENNELIAIFVSSIKTIQSKD